MEYTDQDIKQLTKVAEKWATRVTENFTLDKEKAKAGIEWLYKYCSIENSPKVHFTTSPLAMQILVNTDGLLTEEEMTKNVKALADRIAELDNYLILPATGQKLEYYQTASYGNVSDYTWASYYDYLLEKGDDNVSPDFPKYKEMLEANIYDMIQLVEDCIVSPMPKLFKLNERNNLHCEDGPAMSWEDGFELYFINGTPVPKKYVVTPAKELDVNLVIQEKNVERRQFLVHKIGYNRVFKELGGSLIQAQEALDLYKENPIGDYSQHGDVLIKPESGITKIDFKYLLPEIKERLKSVSYSLINLNLGDDRVRPFLRMTNASLPDEEHLEPVSPECDTIFKAICFRNEMDCLPYQIS